MKKVIYFILSVFCIGFIAQTGQTVNAATNSQKPYHTFVSQHNKKFIYMNNPENKKYHSLYENENGEYVIYFTDYEERIPWGLVAKIFFNGMVVGWVIDGVIHYATGKSPGEWISYGLHTIEQKIREAASTGQKIIYADYYINWGPYTCPGVVIDHSGRCN